MPRFGIQLYIGFALVLAGSFFMSGEVLAAGPTQINTTITSDTTWSLADSPYIIQGTVTLAKKKKLIIEPGVIIKFDQYASLVIKGSLMAEGNTHNKIIFTSLKDDSAGGDTNGDGTATIPAQGDWTVIKLEREAKAVVIDYAEIRYGGEGSSPMVYVDTRQSPPNRTTITNSVITYSHNTAIEDQGIRTIIKGNIITNNGSYGIRFNSVAGGDISENDIHYNGTIPPDGNWGGGIYARMNGGSNFIKHNNIYGNRVDFRNESGVYIDTSHNYWGSPLGPIVCHGHGACVGENGRGTISISESNISIVDKVLAEVFLTEPFVREPEPEPEPEEPPEPQLPDPVILVPGIGACINLKVMSDIEESSFEWDLFGSYYQGLIQTFEASGFTLGEDLFVGCYDWRQTNGYNPDAAVNSGEEYLTHWIDEAKAASGRDKVDIVAHSMGGLLTRSYVQGERYRDDVNDFIMMGTPNHGASDSYYAWEGGEIPETWYEIKNLVKTYLFYLKYKGGFISNKETIQESMTSIQQLLPTYDYIFKNQTQQLMLTSLLSEQNEFLNALNEEDEVIKLTDRLNSVTIIHGDNVSTRNTIAVDEQTFLDVQLDRWIDGRPDGTTDNRLNGDGTVLSSSALLDNIASSTLSGVDHSALPDDAAGEVLDILGIAGQGTFSSLAVDDMLVVLVASPVEPVVTAPDGSQVGAGINEISGAQYFSAGDTGMKLIAIPNPQSGDYQVSLTGTGAGTYDAATLYFTPEVTLTSETSGTAVSGQEIDYSFTMQAGESPVVGPLILPEDADVTVPDEEATPDVPAPSGGSSYSSAPTNDSGNYVGGGEVLGLKVGNEDEEEPEVPQLREGNFIYRTNLFYSETMEEIILQTYYN